MRRVVFWQRVFLWVFASYAAQGAPELVPPNVTNTTGRRSEIVVFSEDFEKVDASDPWQVDGGNSIFRDNTTAARGNCSARLVGAGSSHRKGYFSYLCDSTVDCELQPVRLSFYFRVPPTELSGPYVVLTEVLHDGTLVPAVPVFASNGRVMYNFVDEFGGRYTSKGTPFEPYTWYRVDVRIDWSNPHKGVSLFINSQLAECGLPLRNGEFTRSVGRIDIYNFDAPYSWVDAVSVVLQENGNHWSRAFCAGSVELSDWRRRAHDHPWPPRLLSNGTHDTNSTVVVDPCDPPCDGGSMCTPTSLAVCAPAEVVAAGPDSVEHTEQPAPFVFVVAMLAVVCVIVVASFFIYRRWSVRRQAAAAAAAAAGGAAVHSTGALPPGLAGNAELP